MNAVFPPPRMTQQAFLAWAAAQEGRYEFDGRDALIMSPASNTHSQIAQNIYAALRGRLRGTHWRVFGPNSGVETAAGAVRLPDALVTGTKPPGSATIVPGAVVVFEVLNPNSGQVDRIQKVREYRAVPSIRHYVILEYTTAALTLLDRASPDQDWTATARLASETLPLPALGIEIPVAELYEDVDLPPTTESGAAG